MATAIGLSMQLSASTSGLSRGLSEAEKLINQVGRGAEQAARYFENFRDAASGALPSAMQTIVDQAGALTTQFRAGAVDSAAFAEGIRGLAAEAANVSKAYQEGAGITAQYRTEEEKRAAQVERLGQLLAVGAINEETYGRALAVSSGSAAASAAAEAERAAALQQGAAVTAKYLTDEEKRSAEMARLAGLLEQGAISQETYDRAIADASGSNAEAARAEAERADAVQRAAQITAQNLTPTEKYDNAIDELEGHLEAGRISQETFNRGVASAEAALNKAANAARGAGEGAESAGLKFNELSGLFSLLPGPIGNVAGRLSGFASSGDALQKIFAGGGGVQGALGALTGSITALINPFTLAVAGIAAFGAAAAAVTRSLLDLSDKVEKLGNQADKLGASFEFIQVLDVAAQRSGSSIEALGSSFNRFLNKLDEAKQGSEKAVAAFARIGISAEDLKNQKPEEIYRRMATGIAELEDPAARAGVAMDLLGRSGLDLIPTFKNIAQTDADMKRFFATLSEFDKIRFEGFDSSVEALETSTSGLGRALTLPFVGLGDGISRGSAEFIGGITAIVKPIGQVLEPVLTQLGRAIEFILTSVGAVGRTIGAIFKPIGDAFAAISEAISPVMDAFYDFGATIVGVGEQAAAFIASFSPLNLVGEAIEYVSSAVQPFIDAFGEGVSYVGEVASRVGAIISAAFERLQEIVASTIGRVVEIIGGAISSFLEWSGIGERIQATNTLIANAFNALYESIKNAIGQIGGFIESVLSFAEEWLGIKKDIEGPVDATVELNTAEVQESATMFYKEISKASDAAAKLGEEGTKAALAYSSELEMIAELVAEGTYSQEEGQRAAAQATAEFEKQIAPLEEQRKERERLASEAEKNAERQIEADRRVADQLIENQRIDAEFGGNKERAKAAEDMLAVEREIARVQAEATAAMEDGDVAAAAAASARLAALDQAQAALRDTAQFGFNQADVDEAIGKVREDIEKSVSDADIAIAPDAAEDFFERIKELEQQLELKIIDPKQFEEASKAAKKTFDEAKQQAEKIRDLEMKYAEEAAKIQEERVAELSKVSQVSLQANDVRTGEGASQFLALATGREDPAIEEYRKQLKKLEEIRKEIRKAETEAVEIM